MCHSSLNSSSHSKEVYSGSRDPSTSLSSPSFVPLVRSSEGRFPVQVPIEDKNKRFYDISESSGSKSEESVSGKSDPDFTCQGINSSLLVRDLARIRKKYDLPVNFSLAVPEAPSDACSPKRHFRDTTDPHVTF